MMEYVYFVWMSRPRFICSSAGIWFAARIVSLWSEWIKDAHYAELTPNMKTSEISIKKNQVQ